MIPSIYGLRMSQNFSDLCPYFKLLNAVELWAPREPGRHQFVHQTFGVFLPLTSNLQFINLLSGSDLRIGTELESCTSDVQISRPFEVDGHTITLIDTPGFDDTKLSDTNVLNMIAAYLSYSYVPSGYTHTC